MFGHSTSAKDHTVNASRRMAEARVVLIDDGASFQFETGS
jgi:hypothetical protein